MTRMHLVCATLCLLGLAGKPNLVQGGKLNLMSNLMKQADTLKHGLDLANQVGDIGKFLCGRYTSSIIDTKRLVFHFQSSHE